MVFLKTFRYAQMKLTELLAKREQELLQEIDSLEKVELTLKECREELEAVRQAQGVSVPSHNLLKVKEEPDVSDLLLIKEEFERKFHRV